MTLQDLYGSVSFEFKPCLIPVTYRSETRGRVPSQSSRNVTMQH